MKIALFFGNAGNPGPHSSGTERYEIELARALAEVNTAHELHYIYLFEQGPETTRIPPGRVTTHVARPSVRPISLTLSVPALLRRLRPDVVHATYIPPWFTPPPLVYTLPCSSPFLFPELFDPGVGRKMRVLFGRGLSRARSVICYSRSLQEWVLQRTGWPPDRAPVVPMAASRIFRPLDPQIAARQTAEQFGVPSPYFLFSGRLEKRKNVLRVIEAFARFVRESGSGYSLALSGSFFWATEEARDLARRLGVDKHVIFLGRVCFEDSPLLYAGARALVFPSLWETFGLPVVEAMSCGTPVLTSNTSCLPEVSGGAALLVDPLSVDSIADGMCRLAADDTLAAHLRGRSLRRAADFSWERTARLTLDAYASCAGRSGV